MMLRLNYHQANREAVRALQAFSSAVEALGLDKRLLHLIKLRSSQINGCANCLDMHAHEARLDGENQQRLDTLQAWRETDFFAPRERAALAWTEALTRIAETQAPDDAYDMLKTEFDENEQVAVTMAINMINSWNRVAIGFRMTPAHR